MSMLSWMARSSMLIELPLKRADNVHDLVKAGNFPEEHLPAHGFVVLAPSVDLIGWRHDPQMSGAQCRVVHPGPVEEDLAVGCDPLEQPGTGHRLGGNSLGDQAP